jgi:hypothetical protein
MPEPPREVHTRQIDLFHAGISDKYGHVYVEKVASGFEDRDEPVALLRARDDLAMKVMVHYLTLNVNTDGVPERQVKSVQRQVARFHRWRRYRTTRLPGTTRSPGTK